MRIGFDGRYIQDQYHGIGRYAFQLLRHLVDLDSAHQFVVFWDPSLPNTRFDLQGLLDRPRVESRIFRFPLYWPQDQLAFPLVTKRLHLDLIHTPYFCLPILAPCPLVLTVHDLIFERHPEYMPRRWARGYYRLLMSLGLRRASMAVVNSDATRRDLLAFYRISACKVAVTTHAVDDDYLPASAEQIVAVRRRYDLPDTYILCVGTRRPHKNIAAVIRALGLIRGRIPDALVLVGKRDPRFPDDVSPLVRQLRLEDRVVELGFVDERDLPAIYSGAAVCVHPSFIEGFGLPVLEALSCGTPVITSDRFSMPELGGDAALLVNPTDDAALAKALLEVLTDPAKQDERHERALAQASRFSWRRTAEQTLAVYDTIVGGR